METDSNINFTLGQLTGQVTALIATIATMSNMITQLDSRLQRNEKETNTLTVKIATIGVIAGGVGSMAITFATKFLFK